MHFQPISPGSVAVSATGKAYVLSCLTGSQIVNCNERQKLDELGSEVTLILPEEEIWNKKNLRELVLKLMVTWLSNSHLCSLESEYCLLFCYKCAVDPYHLISMTKCHYAL